MHPAAIALIGFATSVVVVRALIPVLKHRVLDIPNHRSSHSEPTPRGGGVGVLVAVCVALATYLLAGDANIPGWFMVGVLGAAMIGLGDDLWSLSARLRLLLQVICAGVIAGSVVDPGSFQDFMVFALGAIFIVGFINAFNFMDGINGISGCVGALTGAWYALMGSWVGIPWTTAVGLGLTGATVGFLVWNMAGRVFLGDTGSYLLGAAAAGLGFSLWYEGDLSWLAAGAPLALYITDTAWTLARRIRAGERPGVAHRDHAYQQLVDGGLSHLAVTAVVSCAVALICVGSAIAPVLPAAGVALVLAVPGLYLYLPKLIGMRGLSA